ncbi:phosphotransferase family protein [Phenylobacterium aquaticum]|uniref:phosphotransferase family protein n=1 Tax=Phenylobacterium aquaticum TaxID=1763816 RepID=UPI0026F09034|nr:phosphotransferase family protein [Phenylobacterium aquaticum]
METAVDLGALSAWMDRQGLGAGPLEDAALLAGGTQNILLKFRRGERTYVLRRPPPHLRANSNETMRREARMLAAIAETGVPHPRLIAACPEEDVIGAAFYLMEPIDGFNPTTGLPPLHAGSPNIRHRMGLALVEGIAALGALDYRALGLEGFGKPDNYLGRQVERWKGQLASYSEFEGWTGPAEIPGVDKVAAWLTANQPQSFIPGIIHGDYHLANVMYRHDGPELAAIVDWELTTIGDPLLDLGWLMATWPEGEIPDPSVVTVKPWTGFPTAAQLVEHYRPRTARDLASLDWYAVLACYKLGIILEGTHARACAGRAPKPTGDRLHAQTLSLFARALRWIG